MLFSRGQSRALLCLCAAAVLAHCGQSFEYEASTNSTLPSADYSKPDSPIPVFEDQAFAELASDFLLTQSSNTVPGRIDTHHHYVPSFYAEYLEQYSASRRPSSDVSLIVRCPSLMLHTHRGLRGSRQSVHRQLGFERFPLIRS